MDAGDRDGQTGEERAESGDALLRGRADRCTYLCGLGCPTVTDAMMLDAVRDAADDNVLPTAALASE
ncbi:hypothetical protein [Humibacter ginsengisoli]